MITVPSFPFLFLIEKQLYPSVQPNYSSTPRCLGGTWYRRIEPIHSISTILGNTKQVKQWPSRHISGVPVVKALLCSQWCQLYLCITLKHTKQKPRYGMSEQDSVLMTSCRLWDPAMSEWTFQVWKLENYWQ